MFFHLMAPHETKLVVLKASFTLVSLIKLLKSSAAQISYFHSHGVTV